MDFNIKWSPSSITFRTLLHVLFFETTPLLPLHPRPSKCMVTHLLCAQSTGRVTRGCNLSQQPPAAAAAAADLDCDQNEMQDLYAPYFEAAGGRETCPRMGRRRSHRRGQRGRVEVRQVQLHLEHSHDFKARREDVEVIRG